MVRPSRGFTLVELLVVIVIIGMLVGMMIPAVQYAREAARQAQCLNNQKELQTAILNFDVNKNRVPGSVNPILGSDLRISWLPCLMPYLGRNDLWEGGASGGWQKGNGPKNRVSQAICPGDPPDVSAFPTIKEEWTWLSYVVNASIFKNRSDAIQSNGLVNTLHDVSRSRVKSSSQTVMLGERTLLPTSSPPYGRAGGWDFKLKTDNSEFQDATGFPLIMAQGQAKLPWKLVFAWPDPTGSDPMPNISPQVFSSTHPNIVIVTFFDGHSEKVKADVLCNNVGTDEQVLLGYAD